MLNKLKVFNCEYYFIFHLQIFIYLLKNYKNMKKVTGIITIIITCLIILTTFSFSTYGYSKNQQKFEFGTDFDILTLIKSVNESRLTYFYKNLLKFGVRYTGTPNCSNAGNWIYEEFEKMGLDVEFHEWNYDIYESRNIVATLPGNDQNSNAIFILSAHYDTFQDSPGANDDGSGIVAIMTIAEILSSYSFNHTIRFIAFSGEEVGTYGSYIYAREAYNNEDNIVAVLNLDIIGFAETSFGGKIIRFFHESPSDWIASFAQEIALKYYNILNIAVESLPNYPGADNQAFVDYGYEGVWIAQHDSNRVGHSPDDTFENINITYQMKTTKIMLAIITELAVKPINIQVIIKSPFEGMGYINNKPVIELSFPDNFFQRLRGITIVIGRPISTVEVICKDNIKYVVFSINDAFTLWDSEPPYEWKIQGKYYPLIGRHKLKVFAYSETGEYDTDEMEIIFFTTSYQYGKW